MHAQRSGPCRRACYHVKGSRVAFVQSHKARLRVKPLLARHSEYNMLYFSATQLTVEYEVPVYAQTYMLYLAPTQAACCLATWPWTSSRPKV